MQVPVQIDFIGCDPAPNLRATVEEKLQALESRFGRITAGRVAIRGPSGHHRTGGLYEVAIHLTLPGGRSVNVERVPTPDERFGDPAFATNDAFKRARRQLQDQVRKMDPTRVKQHESPTLATVARIDTSGEFGFLETEDGSEIYFHRNSVLNQGFAHLKPGSKVRYVEELGNEGLQASTVELVGLRRPS